MGTTCRYSAWVSTLSDLDGARVTQRLAAPLLIRSASAEPDGADAGSRTTTAASALTCNGGAGAAAKSDQAGGEKVFLRSGFDRRLLAIIAEVQHWSKFDGKFIVPFFASDLANSHADSMRVLRQHVLGEQCLRGDLHVSAISSASITIYVYIFMYTCMT